MNNQYVAIKAFIIDEDTDRIFIMKKGTKDILNPEKWEVPGGKIEWGEQISETLQREVLEESGLTIEVGEIVATPWSWTFQKSDGTNNQIIACGMVCHSLSNELDLSNQTATDDLVEGKWVSISEVLTYDLIPNMRPAMEQFTNYYFDKKRRGLSAFEKFVELSKLR